MLNVKPHKQKPSFCGPSCLKMVFEYYGIRKTEKELGKIAGTTLSKGTRAEKLLRTAQRYGFDGYIKDGATFDDIRKYVLTKRVPVIVNWFYDTEGHYSVVVGINQKNIYLQDPYVGKIKRMPLKPFRTVWFDFLPPYLTKKSEMFIRRLIVIAPKGIVRAPIKRKK